MNRRGFFGNLLKGAAAVAAVPAAKVLADYAPVTPATVAAPAVAELPVEVKTLPSGNAISTAASYRVRYRHLDYSTGSTSLVGGYVFSSTSHSGW